MNFFTNILFVSNTIFISMAVAGESAAAKPKSYSEIKAEASALLNDEFGSGWINSPSARSHYYDIMRAAARTAPQNKDVFASELKKDFGGIEADLMKQYKTDESVLKSYAFERAQSKMSQAAQHFQELDESVMYNLTWTGRKKLAEAQDQYQTAYRDYMKLIDSSNLQPANQNSLREIALSHNQQMTGTENRAGREAADAGLNAAIGVTEFGRDLATGGATMAGMAMAAPVVAGGIALGFTGVSADRAMKKFAEAKSAKEKEQILRQTYSESVSIAQQIESNIEATQKSGDAVAGYKLKKDRSEMESFQKSLAASISSYQESAGQAKVDAWVATAETALGAYGARSAGKGYTPLAPETSIPMMKSLEPPSSRSPASVAPAESISSSGSKSPVSDWQLVQKNENAWLYRDGVGNLHEVKTGQGGLPDSYRLNPKGAQPLAASAPETPVDWSQVGVAQNLKALNIGLEPGQKVVLPNVNKYGRLPGNSESMIYGYNPKTGSLLFTQGEGTGSIPLSEYSKFNTLNRFNAPRDGGVKPPQSYSLNPSQVAPASRDAASTHDFLNVIPEKNVAAPQSEH